MLWQKKRIRKAAADGIALYYYYAPAKRGAEKIRKIRTAPISNHPRTLLGRATQLAIAARAPNAHATAASLVVQHISRWRTGVRACLSWAPSDPGIRPANERARGWGANPRPRPVPARLGMMASIRPDPACCCLHTAQRQ
jgi:hypothetical protein